MIAYCSFSNNPPTPLGSTGCEIVSGSPHCPPILGFRSRRSPWGVPPGVPPLPPSVKSAGAKKPAICDIGTEILYFQCFVTTDMFLFCKPIIFSGNCCVFRDLAFGSVKTRFKAISKKLDFSAQIVFSAQIDFFMNFCPRRATKVRSL